MNPATLKRLAASLIGGAVLLLCSVYIARNFQWREAFTLVSGANLAWFLAGGGGGVIGFWLMRTLRWRLLLRETQPHVPLVDLYLCSAVALSLSVFTPFQSGELLKVELLKKYGHVGRLPGYSTLLLERIADFYAVIAIGIIALATRLGSASHVDAAWLALLLLGMPVAAYLLLHRLRVIGRVGQVVNQIQSSVSSPTALCMLLILTFLSWTMSALAWQACFLSLSIALGFSDMLGLLSIITLVTIASFIPGGLGVAEAGVTELLIGYGISTPLAQAGALILRALSLLIVAMGLFHWLWLGLKWKREAQRAGEPNGSDPAQP